jgi:hypothetical protein
MMGRALVCCVALGCGGSEGGTTDAANADGTPDAITLPIVEAYGKAWDAEDSLARRNLLEYSAVDTLALYEPARMLSSREAVYTAMTQFHTDVPGGTIPLVGNIREKHDRVWIRWRTLDRNQTEILVGLDLMRRSADHRLDRVNSFFGTLPTILGADTAVQQAFLDAWNQSDAGQRMTLLDTAVTDDVVVVLEDEAAIATGRTALSTLIGARLTASPDRQLARTTGYLTMPTAFHTAWKTTASDGTTVLATGVMMCLLAGDGRISEIVVWNSTEP